MKKENLDFRGVIFFGLMVTTDGVKVLEFNTRFGDPETQSIMLRLDTNLMDIFVAVSENKLNEVKPVFNDKKVTSKNDLIPYLFLSEKPYDSGYDDDIWEVNINNVSLQKDPANIEGAYVTTEKIPSENLSLIYEGTGESL